MDNLKETAVWDSEKFKERFNTLVNESGKTTRELAAEIGVSNPLISQWKNGKRTPTIASVIMIAKYFNVSVDWLLGLEEKNNRSKTLDARVAAEYTGLTDGAVQYLNRIIRNIKNGMTYGQDIDVDIGILSRLSEMIESQELTNICLSLNNFYDAALEKAKKHLSLKAKFEEAKQKENPYALYKVVYDSRHPLCVTHKGESMEVPFELLMDVLPQYFEELARYINSFSNVDALIDDILEQNFYTEKCDLQQLQIQKKINKEILKIEQAAFKAAVKAGGSNGTDNEENG